jgi:dUTP pyrophosphatase
MSIKKENFKWRIWPRSIYTDSIKEEEEEVIEIKNQIFNNGLELINNTKEYIIKIKTDTNFKLEKAYNSSAGYDLYANIEEEVIIEPLEIKIIPTGLFFELPENIDGQIRSKSGLSTKGILCVNSPGTVDSNYRGEIKIILGNISKESYTINPREKIAQIIFSKVLNTTIEYVDELNNTTRGNNGFGSSGKF